MPATTRPSIQPPPDVEIELRGGVPSSLSGRMVGIGRDGVVHSVQVHMGKALSYRSRRLRTDAALHNVLAFGGSILAFGDDSPAYEVSPGLDTLHRVDLGGQGRVLAPFPKHDPLTRDLHLVARASDGTQAHVAVSAGALTRRNRPILHIPSRIHDLALTRDRIVFVADGFVGIAPRGGDARCTWIATGAAALHPLLAYDAGDTVVLLALSPSLERWTVHPDSVAVQREVLDPTPRRFAHLNADSVDEVPRLVWTTGGEVVGHHDLAASRHMYHNLRPQVPGDLIFVTDPARSDAADSGWLVGFVHDPSSATTEFRVIDAADIAGRAIATVSIPRRIPRGLRCTWIPSSQQ